jgi:hypothetical protein
MKRHCETIFGEAISSHCCKSSPHYYLTIQKSFKYPKNASRIMAFLPGFGRLMLTGGKLVLNWGWKLAGCGWNLASCGWILADFCQVPVDFEQFAAANLLPADALTYVICFMMLIRASEQSCQSDESEFRQLPSCSKFRKMQVNEGL